MEINRCDEAVLKIQQDRNENALSEKYESEKDQNEINAAIKDGLVYYHDLMFGFKRVEIFENMTIMLPEEFNPMGELFIKRKYPNENRPQIVFTDSSTQINITFTYTDYQVYEKKFESFLANIMDTVKKQYPMSPLISSESLKDRSEPAGYFDFVSPAFDKKIYNFMFMYLIDTRILFASVNCPESKKDLWKTLSYGIMASFEREGTDDE